MPRYDSILGTIGNRPVVRINRPGPSGINLWVKVEAFNPLDSVKDRLAPGTISLQSDTSQPGAHRHRSRSDGRQPRSGDQKRNLRRHYIRRPFAASLPVSSTTKTGANILRMLPDTGERYLSTPLFSDITADMTEEERMIYESTQRGVCPAPLVDAVQLESQP